MNENVVKDILKKIRSGEIAPSEGKKLLSKSKCIMDRNMEKAIVLTKPMSISDVRLENISMHDPQSGEVQIQIMSFGINFSDILSIEGMYPNMPEYPFTPGCECAGIVSKIGKNVTKVKIGDKVLCTNNITFGSHSTVINTSENYVYVIPEAIDFNDISGLSLIFMINYHIFKNINLVKGEKILIQRQD